MWMKLTPLHENGRHFLLRKQTTLYCKRGLPTLYEEDGQFFRKKEEILYEKGRKLCMNEADNSVRRTQTTLYEEG